MSMSSKKILIIEDEPQIRQFLRISLEAQTYDVSLAVTAKEAIAFSESQHCDLIILDLGLPDRDGQDVIRILRKQTQAPIIDRKSVV